MQPRVFNWDDQTAFAELSGDYNPIHMDVVAARRSLFGRPVVHGIHLVLCALDSWLQVHRSPVSIRSLRALFVKPVGLDEPVQFVVSEDSSGRVKLEALVDGVLCARMICAWQAASSLTLMTIPSSAPPRCPSVALSSEMIPSQSGKLELLLPVTSFSRLFPAAARWLPVAEASVLLASTRLVGVYCPGLHSIYSELSLKADALIPNPELNYHVASFDERFGLVNLKMTSAGFTGEIKAFLRPPPQEQPSFRACQSVVRANAFARHRALVIGGSRGLGELAAKILCAGGAEVRLTYHLGEMDARRVMDEISCAGGRVAVFRFDVLNPDKRCLAGACSDWSPTHLFYFATPHITPSVKGSFSRALFEKFCGYYVAGFSQTMDALRPLGLRGVFYPSSVYVDEPPRHLAEYAAAKAAGEALCRFHQKNFPEVRIFCPRLPRLATDQTASLIDVQIGDDLTLMLQYLLQFAEFCPAR
jgi:hypothetical protein